ncbi:MAG: RIP metalloprotease RseP [Patescibacteria group bacterium]
MILTIVAFVIILSLLVFVHELGHFLTAIKFGVRVDEFGFGLPPRIIGYQVEKIPGTPAVTEEDNTVAIAETESPSELELTKETILTSRIEVGATPARKKIRWVWGNKFDGDGQNIIYSLNWIPIGGFVKIKGENGDSREEKDSFGSKSIAKRVGILSAGVIMNLFLCIVLLSLGFMIGLPSVIGDNSGGQIVSQPKVQVLEVIADTPAKQADIHVGDVIVSIDGQAIEKITDLQTYLAGKKDQKVTVQLTRDASALTKELTIKEFQGTVGMGVSLMNTGIVRFPWYLAIWHGLKTTFIWLVTIFVTLFLIIKNLIFGAPIGVELAGPVGIAVLTGQAAKMGFIYVLQFAALLSLNLAIINILPFPALDGGRIMFLIVEKVRGRAIKQKWENLSHNIGFLLLMLLVLVVTYKDVLRYGGRIAGAFKKIIGA